MRENFINWDEYFMGLAILSCERSKDPSTQVGAVVVKDNKILSIGYNGFPIGINDLDLPWEREGEFLSTKYPYVCHAELNCIINAKCSLEGSTIYVTLFPCNECSKVIIQSGIKKIIYLDDKNKNIDSSKASVKMLQLANIKYEKYQKNNKKITIDL